MPPALCSLPWERSPRLPGCTSEVFPSPGPQTLLACSIHKKHSEEEDPSFSPSICLMTRPQSKDMADGDLKLSHKCVFHLCLPRPSFRVLQCKHKKGSSVRKQDLFLRLTVVCSDGIGTHADLDTLPSAPGMVSCTSHTKYWT